MERGGWGVLIADKFLIFFIIISILLLLLLLFFFFEFSWNRYHKKLEKFFFKPNQKHFRYFYSDVSPPPLFLLFSKKKKWNFLELCSPSPSLLSFSFFSLHFLPKSLLSKHIFFNLILPFHSPFLFLSFYSFQTKTLSSQPQEASIFSSNMLKSNPTANSECLSHRAMRGTSGCCWWNKMKNNNKRSE